MQEQQVSHTSTVLRLVGVVVGMFGFGFALVPLYEIFCEITGANGKTAGKYEAAETQVVDTSRTVKIQFLTNRNAGLSWDFRPTVRQMEVHPGEMYETEFFVRNPTRGTVVAQAVPSVAPFYAAEYLHKTECFCFEQQYLDSGEGMDMPLRFIVDKNIPADVKTLTLSYTLFDVTENFAGQLAGE